MAKQQLQAAKKRASHKLRYVEKEKTNSNNKKRVLGKQNQSIK